MKRIVVIIGCLTVSSIVSAIPPVILSGPTPALATSYPEGQTNTLIYRVKNNVPKKLPLSVYGISGAIKRINVANDCGNFLPAGPKICNIGIAITPTSGQIGSKITQTLKVDYQGRLPLTSKLSFIVESGVPTARFAYIGNEGASSGTTLRLCDVNNASGLLENCRDPQGTFGGPIHIITKKFGNVNYAYIANVGTDDITRCEISSTTGEFLTCSDSGVLQSFAGPSAIAFLTLTNGNTHAYVVNKNTYQIKRCPVDNNGLFLTTLDSGAGAIFHDGTNAPTATSIAFNTVGGVTYAYVLEGSSGFTDKITKCNVNSASGEFFNCNTTSIGFNGPYGILFHRINNQSIAYVSSWISGNIYTCSVSNNNGNLNCNNTPITVPGGPANLSIIQFGGTAYLYIPNGVSGMGSAVFLCPIHSATGALSICHTASSESYNWPFSVGFF